MVKQKDRIYMPMGTGGLLRYPGEEKEIIKIKPKVVVAIVVALAAFEILLKIFLA